MIGDLHAPVFKAAKMQFKLLAGITTEHETKIRGILEMKAAFN